MSSELDYSVYGSVISDDDETEQEAIRLIQSQVIEINHLKLQLHQKTESEPKTILSQQVQTQIEQINFLQSQLSIFEQKFGALEQSYELQQSSAQCGLEKELSLVNSKLKIAESYLIKETKRRHELETQLRALKVEVSVKKDVCENVKGQVEKIQDDFQSVSTQMHDRESDLKHKLSQCKKQKLILQKYLQNKEIQIKEFNSQLNEKQQEIASLTQKNQEKELKITKLRAEKTMAKQQKESFEHKISTIESQNAELNGMIQRMTKENEREVRKRSDLLKERDNALENSLKLQTIFSTLGVEDPEKFQQNFESLKLECNQAKKQIQDQAKIFNQSQQKLLKKENVLQDYQLTIQQSIEKLTQWLKSHLKLENLSSTQDEELLTQCDPIFQPLTQALKKSILALNKSLNKLRTRQNNSEQDMINQKRVYSQLNEDFKKLQTQISTQTHQQELKIIENTDQKLLATKLQQIVDSQSIEMQSHQKFLIECYNQLLSIRDGMAASKLVSESMQLHSDFNTDKQKSVLELIQQIGTFLNCIQFEIKSTEIKQARVIELEQLLFNERIQADQSLQQTKLDLFNQIQQYRNAGRDLETSNQEYQKQLAQIGESQRRTELQMQALQKEKVLAEQKFSETKIFIKSVRNSVRVLIQKLIQTNEEKQMLIGMVNLRDKIIKQANFELYALLQQSNERVIDSPIKKLRRCLIVIIAANRLRNKSKITIDLMQLEKYLCIVDVNSEKYLRSKFTPKTINGSVAITDLLKNKLKASTGLAIQLSAVKSFIQMTNQVIFEHKERFEIVSNQLQIIEDKHVRLQGTHKELLIMFTKHQQERDQINQELFKETVPRTEYQRLVETLTTISQEVSEMRRQTSEVEQQFAQQTEKMNKVQVQNSQLQEKIIEVQMGLSDKQREIELKEIKLSSLEELLKRNTNQMQDKSRFQQLEGEIAADKKLIKKLQTTIQRQQLTMNERLAEQLKQQLDVQKLLEKDLSTLQSRCEQLQFQNELLKNEKAASFNEKEIIPQVQPHLPQNIFVALPTFSAADQLQPRSLKYSGNFTMQYPSKINSEQENNMQQANPNHSFQMPLHYDICAQNSVTTNDRGILGDEDTMMFCQMNFGTSSQTSMNSSQMQESRLSRHFQTSSKDEGLKSNEPKVPGKIISRSLSQKRI